MISASLCARALTLACATALPSTATAEYAGSRETTHDFAVRLVQYDVRFSDQAGAFDSTVKQVSFSWREAFGERIKAGLYGGYTYLSQDDNPLSAGDQLDGWHAGTRLDIALYRGERIGLNVGAGFLYQRVDEDRPTTPLELEWSEIDVYVGFGARLGKRLTLLGGGSYLWLDGEQRVSGVSPSTIRFDNRDAGGFVGLDLEIDNQGHIGLVAETGLRQGGQIYFLKRF